MIYLQLQSLHTSFRFFPLNSQSPSVHVAVSRTKSIDIVPSIVHVSPPIIYLGILMHCYLLEAVFPAGYLIHDSSSYSFLRTFALGRIYTPPLTFANNILILLCKVSTSQMSGHNRNTQPANQ